MRLLWILLIPLALTIGCSSSQSPVTKGEPADWNGGVQQWGTLREVMHGEVMEGQVRLSDVTDTSHIFGIGAPDQLQGEILIADSVAWVAKVRDGNRIETQRNSPKDSAVFLAVARVPRWRDVKVDRDVSADQFDDLIQETILRSALDKLETIPFVIDGDFPSLKLHVLNGQCPFAEVKSNIEGAGPPHRMTLHDVRGRLVGFYSENGAGRITHHSTRTHVHVLAGDGNDRVAGHVDDVALKAGTVIRVPAYRSEGRE